MSKSLKVLAMATVFSMAAAPCLLAADTLVVKVDVPFDFVVADRQLPSGEYRIVKGHDASVVRIYSKDNQQMVTAFVLPGRTEVKEGAELVFHRYGNQRFLKTIGTARGFAADILESPVERAAQAQAAGGAMPVAAMR